MHPRIGTASTKYTTHKTRTSNAKYNYKPEELGCIKFLLRPVYRYMSTLDMELQNASTPSS